MTSIYANKTPVCLSSELIAHGPGREAPRGRGPYGNMGTGQRSSFPHSVR